MENKKTKIVSIIAIIALVLTLVTATYAYFQAQTGEGSQADVKINASTLDTLTFETGDAISLSLDQENFAQGTGNKTGSTFAKAMLTANNKTNSATEHYYLYLNISSNTFTYTQNESTPEILLTIKDGSNNEITSISGLTHKTVTDANGTSITGFDITTKSGLITIFYNREITTTSSKIENWKTTITYVNYDTDQSKNAGKSFVAKLMVQKEKMLTLLSDVCTDGDNLANCITTLSQRSVSGATSIYYHNSALENGAKDNSYRYAGDNGHLDYYSCTYNGNKVFHFDVENSEETSTGFEKGDCSIIYKITAPSYDEGVYYDKGLEFLLNNKVLVKYDDVNNKCVTSSEVDVIYPDGSAVDKTSCTGIAYGNSDRDIYFLGIEEVGAGTETFVAPGIPGANNFICFGSTESLCPIDNLYRIIGVFGENNHGVSGKQLVKLIKYDYANSNLLGIDGGYITSATTDDISTYKGIKTSIDAYYWNGNTGTNTWSTSIFNKTNLNTNYLNNIGTEWANKIATTTWKVGGNTLSNIGKTIPSIAYQNEVVNPIPGSTSTTGETEYQAKIGLMYVSDYGFAASPSAWSLPMYNYNDEIASTNNWMYMGLPEYTLTRIADYLSSPFAVDVYGNVDIEYYDPYFLGRPVFYLNSSITYKSGSGSMSDPILIN